MIVAAIPEPLHSTVRRIYELHEQRRDEKPRPYLGASQLGEACARRLWLGFRWCGAETFDGRMLRLFETGNREESRLLDELRAIGVTVAGEQHEVEFAGGHGKGHLDGALQGLEEAPKTWHVFECKTMNAKAFKDVQAKGVREAKPLHFAQIIVYMGLSGMDRVAYFAVHKDTDEIYFERIHFDQAAFDKLMAKAAAIVSAAEPPARISEDAAWYECKFCPFHAQCHGEARPAVTCRSCAHSTPIAAGAWHCAHHDAEIPEDAQREGCNEHRYIPALLERVAELVSADGNDVRWRNKLTDKTFDQPQYNSQEMHDAADFRVIGDDFVQHFKEVFGDGTRVTSGPGPETIPEHGDAPASDLEAIYGSRNTGKRAPRAARRA